MKRRFKVENLGCASCSDKMERQISELEGVKEAKVNFMTQRFILNAEDDKFEEIVEKAKVIMDKIEPGVRIKQ